MYSMYEQLDYNVLDTCIHRPFHLPSRARPIVTVTNSLFYIVLNGSLLCDNDFLLSVPVKSVTDDRLNNDLNIV